MTKLCPESASVSYQDRLDKLSLITLEERRKSGDDFMIYKCLTRNEKIEHENLLNSVMSKSGNDKTLNKSLIKRHVGKYSFPTRSFDY